MKKRLILGTLLAIFVLNMVAPVSLAQNLGSSLRTSIQDAPITGDSVESSSGSTYIIGPLGFYMSHLDQFRAKLGADADLEGWSKVIETYFLPLNLRLMIMWVPGWGSGTSHANTTTTNIAFNPALDSFLSACDKYGVSVIFQWAKAWSFTMNGGWDADVYNQFPELAGLHKNGTPHSAAASAGDINWAMIDNPLYFLQLKEDLKQLYEYYGHHKSWIGLGQFKGDYQYYAGKGEIARDIFQTYSLRNYVNSRYYERIVDVNSGLHKTDGTKCMLYDMFYDRSVVFGYEQWLGIIPYWFSGIYGGTGDSGHVAGFKFQAPENLDGFKIAWYGRVKGSPPNPLIIELYRNKGPYGAGEQPANLGNPLESHTATVSGEGWQTAVSFNTRLAKDDYYWVVFQTSGGDASNCYQPYYRSYKRDESTFKFCYEGYTTDWWNFRGCAVLKIQDKNGIDVKIYPYQTQMIRTTSSSGQTQTFISPNRATSFNAVACLFSDRISDQAESILEIKDSSDTVIASVTFTQESMKGFPYNGFFPIFLDQRVTLQPNSQYSITVRTPQGMGWQWHQIITDPASEGFQGQSETLIFKLLDLDIALENFMHVGGQTFLEQFGKEGGTGGLTSSKWYACGFTPTQNGVLSEVSLMIVAGSGTLNVALYSGDSLNPTTQLESKSVSVSGSGWVDVTGWSSSLTAGNYYYIVFSASGGEISPARIVNPYIWINRWSEDGGNTWGYQKEVGDFDMQVVTSQEKIGVCEDGRVLSQITDSKLMGQSFSLASDTVVKGVLVYANKPENDPGSELIAEIRTDNGDQPSSTVLTWGKVSYTGYDQSLHGLTPVDFYLPVRLNAGTKYWLVFRTPRWFQHKNYPPTLEVPFYYLRYPSESYGGATYHAKYSTDKGSSWSKPNGKEGDIIFAVVRAKSTDAYSLQELVDNDLNPYHCFSSPDPPESMRGWNTYLNVQVDKICIEMMEWLEGISGRRWVYITPNNYRIAREAGGQRYAYTAEWTTGPLPTQGPPEDKLIVWRSEVKIQSILRQGGLGFWSGGSLGHTWDNTGAITAEQIGFDYRLTLPLSARSVHVFDMDPAHIMELEEGDSGHETHVGLQEWSKHYGQIMSRMRYHGGYFGNEKKALKALFIGDNNIGVTLQSLTPAIDITVEGFKYYAGDPNLTKYGDFSQFDVIVWYSSSPSMSEATIDLQNRIKNFVNDGGGFVVIGAWEDWANDIIGFDYTTETVSAGSFSYADYDHPILKPYSDVSSYLPSGSLRNKRIDDLGGTKVVYDTNDNPWISTHGYGSGRGVYVGSTGSIETSLPGGFAAFYIFDNSYPVLLTNGVFYAAGKENVLPVWWYKEYYSDLPWHDQVFYTVNGEPGHVLLWLSNNNETTSIEIHLDADFYGIDSAGWVAVDVASWEVVAKGSGTDIKISTTIPAESWKPIYIMNATSDLQAIYSNIFVESQSISTGEAHYTLQGPYKQTSWLLVPSTSQPTRVSVNNTGTLPKHPLDDLLSDSTPNGWYYDSTNKILYVKFHPTSAVDITVSVSTEQLPDLFVDVTLNHSTVSSEGEVSVHVHVTDQTGPVNNAYVQLTSDNGGDFSSSSGNTDSNGDFSSTFSAPNVSQETSVRITASVSKSGYVDGADYEDLTVLPPGASLLYVTVSADPSEIQSSETSTITVHVTDGVNPVSGVAISLLSDMGGTFAAQDGITDSNGDFSTIFTAPSVSQRTTCTLTANATKSGYYDGQGEVQITLIPVASGAEGNGGTEIPWVLCLTAILIVISAVTVLVVLVKRTSKRGLHY